MTEPGASTTVAASLPCRARISNIVIPTPSSKPQQAFAEYGIVTFLSRNSRVANTLVPLRFPNCRNSLYPESSGQYVAKAFKALAPTAKITSSTSNFSSDPSSSLHFTVRILFVASMSNPVTRVEQAKSTPAFSMVFTHG